MRWNVNLWVCGLALATGTAAVAQSHSVLATGEWWKLEATQTGVYRVTTGEVPALAGVAVEKIAVYGGDGRQMSKDNALAPTDDLRELAIEVRDRNGNGVFDSGDEVLFYGEGAGGWFRNAKTGFWSFTHHAYARANYYFLTTSATAGKRVAKVAPLPTTGQRLSRCTVVANHEEELNNIYSGGQDWVGERLTAAAPRQTVSLRLEGANVSDVRVRWGVAIAEVSAASLTLSTDGYTKQADANNSNEKIVDPESIGTGRNTYDFTLSYGAGTGAGYLDFIELNAVADMVFQAPQTTVRIDPQLTYTSQMAMSGAAGVRVWDVTTLGSVRELTVDNGTWSDSTREGHVYVAFDGTGYFAPRSVTRIDNQDLHGSAAVQMVIVSHPLFMDQARRLAGLHEMLDGMTVLTVSDQEVYNEFSSGKQDPMAIRALMRWLKKQYADNAPRYLLLFGKGSYDNRHIKNNSVPTLVTYETNFFSENNYATDNTMGYLDENSSGALDGTMWASVGRLPAKTLDEARHLVDKLEGYMMRRDLADESQRGDWRNYVALLADDADPGANNDKRFAEDSETGAKEILAAYPHLNVERLYADSYHQQSGAIGSFYPDLNNALQQRINYGCLLLNYVGHGSIEYIGTERYMEKGDIRAYRNTDRLPFFVTSTCSFGHYDLPDKTCGAEECVLAEAAMIGVVSAPHPISHVREFNNAIMVNALNPAYTVGDALRLAIMEMKELAARPTSRSISLTPEMGLMGDPALRLSHPRYRVQITHINDTDVETADTIKADVLSRVTVRGEVVDSLGARVEDFDGTVFPVVYDRAVKATTLANDNAGTEVEFEQQKNILYRGSHSVSHGEFEYSFIVPKDVAYQYDYAKLSHYARSASEDASGSFLRLMLGGMSDTLPEGITPPTVRLYMGDTTFAKGGITNETPTLLALLSDSVGINMGTGLGHDITAVIDGNPNSLIVLNDLYQPDIADSRRGSVRYALSKLTPGRHTLVVKAWNIFALSGSDTLSFVVHGDDSLVFSRLACYPNPAVEQTTFLLEVNTPARVKSAEFQIYSSRGQKVYSLTPTVASDGYTVGPVRWDVSAVPPGLYLARMVVTDSEGETHQATTKCIVR